MGSEQSQAAGGSQNNSVNTTPRFNQRPVSSDAGRLQRGYTIAAPTSDSLNNTQLVDSSPPPLDSRPVSPPMSVCSDSDLPYISYTDKPIGGEIKSTSSKQQNYSIRPQLNAKSFSPYSDSPKLRNKGQKVNKSRPAVSLRRQSTSAGATRKITSAPSTLVVVNKGGTSKDSAIEKDPDIARLQVNFPLLRSFG